MGLILTDSSRRDVAEVSYYDLDLAFGDDENDFELVLHEGPALSAGCLAYMDGTEYGGIVDDVASDSATGTVTYSGRTWQGVLAGRVLEPLPGQDYLLVSGDANAALASLVERMGLGGTFSVSGPAAPLRGTYQFDRYIDGYQGIRRMLRSSALRLSMSYADGRVRMSAVPAVVWGDDVDSDRATFAMNQHYRNVNHLICLGKGELRDRVVVHLYADSRGTVSRTRTLTGLDEVAQAYEYSNAEEAELVQKGTEKLRDLQLEGEIDVTVADGSDYAVGDYITGRDNAAGGMVTAEVIKKVLKVDGGVAEVSYTCGMGRARATDAA